jgi:anti-sigma factor ChrR (cupin superfamily)
MLEVSGLDDGAPGLVGNLLAGGWRGLDFEPFRPGVEVHWLRRTEADGASAALLRYAPGAAVPLHEHPGFELALVLDGAQEDDSRTYAAGTLAVQAPGTRHRVSSRRGCVVLLFWEHPVRILE